jgi:hypothetical protein
MGLSARVVAILAVLLVALGGAALLYRHQEAARGPDNAAALGRVPFKDLKAADITAVRIVEPKASLTLQRKDERWVLAERADFPADVSKVREFVLKVIGLKIAQSEPLGEKDRARLNLDASGTRIEFLNSKNESLGVLVIGRKYFKREVENPDRALGDGRFVALPAEAGTAYLVGDPLTQANAKSAEWIDRTSFQVEKVKTLEVRTPAGGGYRIERSGDNADWKLAGLKPGEKLDVSRANAASYSLQLLELADVAPKDAPDTGLDKPTLVDATTLDGLSYAIKVGKLVGENYYVTFTSAGTPKVDEKSKDKEQAKAADKAAREKALSPHVLLIPKSKLEDTLKPRAELLEKPAKKQ